MPRGRAYATRCRRPGRRGGAALRSRTWRPGRAAALRCGRGGRSSRAGRARILGRGRRGAPYRPSRGRGACPPLRRTVRGRARRPRSGAGRRSRAARREQDLSHQLVMRRGGMLRPGERLLSVGESSPTRESGASDRLHVADALVLFRLELLELPGGVRDALQRGERAVDRRGRVPPLQHQRPHDRDHFRAQAGPADLIRGET